jgi:hypothetical protein
MKLVLKRYLSAWLQESLEKAAYLTNSSSQYTDHHAPNAPHAQGARIKSEVEVESCLLVPSREQSERRDSYSRNGS